MVVLGSDPASVGVVKFLVVGSLAAILDWDVDSDVTSAPWGLVPASLRRGSGGGGVVALRSGLGGAGKILGRVAGIVRLGADVMHRRFLSSRPIQALIQSPTEVVYWSIDTSEVDQ